MKEAKWTDVDGSTVTLALPMVGMEGQRNPFEKWTKRRKGHAGTRFMMACVDNQTKQMVYQDEVMLAGWNDSQSSGHTVKFWLATDAMGHPFEGFDRKTDSFYVSLVELDDDETTVNQNLRNRLESKGKSPSQRLSYVAVMLCKNEAFWNWLPVEHQVGVNDEEGAKIAMMVILGLSRDESRSIFDKNDHQAKRFHELIRKPFVEWSDG